MHVCYVRLIAYILDTSFMYFLSASQEFHFVSSLLVMLQEDPPRERMKLA